MKNTEEYQAEIKQKRDELIKLLLDYCQSQVVLWQQVPALAKEANLLKVNSVGCYVMAYECYRWPVYRIFLHGLYVDLKTGELGGGSDGGLVENTKFNEIPLILKKLNAEEVIANLKEEIKVPLADKKQKEQANA